ncbi:fibrobacter succinogenes major paralogous domain-containing protein [Elizabethkingia ursingii]|uniref:FISUMP domain-containing protein n=1 Tax=Elizabethkingia ursingii TaxID=1756150 RepID=UPI0007515042|nr:FISUMP domain-containing protein [Elizabethkingia ursingii]KUY29512.1 hypothetical protein ATB96_02235 [Elizabethkingia ursingii]
MKRNINKNIKHISFSIAILSNLFYISSCRSAEHDNIVAGGGIAAVKINLLGSDYASGKSSNQANLKETGLPVKGNVQRQSKMITPSLFFEAELAPSNDAKKSGRSSTEPTALIAGDQIGAGMKFRIIAYRQDDNSYQGHQDYTVGEQAQPLMLDGGKAYTIIAYSYGSTSALPEISTGEMTNLSQAKIGYDDNNKDLMYQKTEGFIPDGNNPNNKVDIKLRHKLNQITTVINSYIGDISEISWADLRPHHPQGVLSLSTGTISRTYESTERLKFSGTFPTTTAIADPVLINADTNGNLTGLFSASLTVNNVSKTIDLPNTFKITPENKSTLTINLKRCGVYLGPNNTQWKEFMCQNLGATEGINPFSPEAGNHGAKYQWGVNTNEPDRYVSQADDQSNSGAISGWNTTPKPDGSWSDTSKTANDPCPSGYRVPTRAQWQAVIDNNSNVERVGSWATNNTNYSSAFYFRNPSNVRTLMLPAAGFRADGDGTLNFRGYNGNYWSSYGSTSNAGFLLFNSRSVNVIYMNPMYGSSVRCVAE